LLNDDDFLLQALFAERANTSLITHRNAREGNAQEVQGTKLDLLVEIWNRILPRRQLHITVDDIQVSARDASDKYPARDMSDGERAIFYLVGQTLVAAENSLIIFDEPELHIHKAIISRLWDELEAARPNCGMILISHDLEFAASREGQKYVLRDYTPDTGWTIEEVPEDTGFSEEITTLILGSRKPILFVEGQGGSLDKAIFRACYPGWTVIRAVVARKSYMLS
jgi:ATPase subunit of ABC transporter with duplicated ATPase domains